jgi:hypothetical protein
MNRTVALRTLALVAFVLALGLATLNALRAGKPQLGLPNAKLAQPRELRVLFVGNSLTSTNDLPDLVKALATTAGVKMQVAALTHGGYSLEDHWNDGRARRLLASARWDYLVMQQGPSTRPESQLHLRLWATRWANEARRQGVTPVLYMAWPFQNQKNGFELVSQSYRLAALASGSGILPAGEVWAEMLRLDPTTELYQADQLHPTLAGSQVAATVIAQGLLAAQPNTAPALDTMPADLQATLRQAWVRQVQLEAARQRAARLSLKPK